MKIGPVIFAESPMCDIRIIKTCDQKDLLKLPLETSKIEVDRGLKNLGSYLQKQIQKLYGGETGGTHFGLCGSPLGKNANPSLTAGLTVFQGSEELGEAVFEKACTFLREVAKSESESIDLDLVPIDQELLRKPMEQGLQTALKPAETITRNYTLCETETENSKKIKIVEFSVNVPPKEKVEERTWDNIELEIKTNGIDYANAVITGNIEKLLPRNDDSHGPDTPKDSDQVNELEHLEKLVHKPLTLGGLTKCHASEINQWMLDSKPLNQMKLDINSREQETGANDQQELVKPFLVRLRARVERDRDGKLTGDLLQIIPIHTQVNRMATVAMDYDVSANSTVKASTDSCIKVKSEE